MFQAKTGKMIKVGITGQSGFIGSHLYHTLSLYREEFELILFRDEFFSDPPRLNQFVASCDVVVHLAAVNRHADPAAIYSTNIRLVEELIGALEQTGSLPHILFSSSTQEDRDNPYGRSKKEGRILLSDWAVRNGGGFTGLVIPNVFGPFGNPYYNSVIATFSHQLNHDEIPKIEIDAEVKLIYVGELVEEFLARIRNYRDKQVTSELPVIHTSEIKVSDILHLLLTYKEEYLGMGNIPLLKNTFEINLFNTFRSYIDIGNRYPVKYVQHTDTRGAYVEIIRQNGGGQGSFSTTNPGITRGNHFHTRKIERFSVIRGNALIQMRKIGSTEIMDFHLSGDEPAYVDMPVWHTHNITNTGQDELYTLFWVNEFYNADDPDTFFEPV
jgi:UDP-2-acetamido-2,6-beta-L-arabino-hexul-4-ose reductase